jgi:subtilisin
MNPEIVVELFGEVYDWGLRDLHIPEIHKQTMGEGVTIAVIDSGKSEHFEMKNNIIGEKNFSKSPVVEDRVGHGTATSGIIAAGINGEGIIGVAPKGKIYFIKAIDDSGCGSPSALTNGIRWATDQKVDIISISAGMFSDFAPMRDAVIRAYDNNIIIVAAVGNTGNRYYDVAFPARYPQVIGIAAYDPNHKVATFSSRGANISFAAPGVDIYSTWLNNQYCKQSGSSFAAPIMSGICALILSKHKYSGVKSATPCETPKQMMEHLQKYAINIGERNAVGFGMLDTRSMFQED